MYSLPLDDDKKSQDSIEDHQRAFIPKKATDKSTIEDHYSDYSDFEESKDLN